VSFAAVVEKPVPPIVTDVPPDADPLDGETEVTEGAITRDPVPVAGPSSELVQLLFFHRVAVMVNV
jgi:hypothetical protein